MKNNLVFKLNSGRHRGKMFRLNALLALILLLNGAQLWAVDKDDSNQSKTEINAAQQKTVTGTVADASGTPLCGVTVVVKGTTNGTITDKDGNYTLNNVPEDAILQFSFLGMLSEEMSVADVNVMDVTMVEDILGLEEIIVTGYAREKKKDIIGSVAVVNTDDMNTTAMPNLSNRLQGRAAGITVSNTGDGASKIRIRGFGSFTNAKPLYIIDGTPGDGDQLNPDDIESIQILKDAASASIYGARGANGVIIVTTKQGRAGRTKVSFNSYIGMGYANKFPELLNTQEMADMYWRSYEGADVDPAHVQFGNGSSPVIPEYILVSTPAYNYGGTELADLETSDPATYNDLVNPANYDFQTHQIVRYMGDVNWYEEAFRPGLIQNHQFQVSGGNEAAVFSFSANYNQQESLTQYGDKKRLSVRANSMYTIKNVVRVGENLQVQYSNEKDGVNAASLYYMMPYMPVKDEWGNWVGTKVPGTKSDMTNPIADASRQDLDRNGAYNIFGNAYMEIDLFKDLTLKSTIGFSYNNEFDRTFDRRTYENGMMNTAYSSLEYAADQNWSWTWTNLATYSKTIQNHSIRLMAGTEAYRYLSEDLTGTTYDFIIENDINYLVLGQGDNSSALQETDGNWETTTLASYFGRADYSYANKYLINATIRYDGSPVFTPENKWGSFPAIGLGWRISEEGFMSSLDWIYDLKLRASWGIIGNAAGLTAENQYDTYTKTTAAYPDGTSGGYLSSYKPAQIGNTQAKWEETNTTNIGIDATLYDNKWEISAEWFNKETKDLLVRKVTPSTGSAADNAYVNLGSVQNRGFEVLIINRGEITQDLRYEVGLTFSTYKNKATRIYESDETKFEINEFFGNYLSVTQVGQEIAYYYGYELDGFFNSQAEVDAYDVEGSWITPRVGGWKVKDINGDGMINTDDKTYLGSPHPDFITSLNLNLGYKNFDLTAFFYAQVGGEKINVMKWYTDQVSGPYGKSPTLLNDSWTADNQDAKLPALNSLDTYSFTYLTDYWVEDVSFLRLKTLQLGYTLPESILSKIGIDRLRIYVQASNLFTLTKYTNMEPDGSLTNDEVMFSDGTMGTTDLAMGMDRGNAPVPKQLIFGINLDF